MLESFYSENIQQNIQVFIKHKLYAIIEGTTISPGYK